MLNIDFKDHRTQFIILAVVFLSIISLWIRVIPMFSIGNTDLLTMVSSDDPQYNLRQVELMLAHFPNYAWFDPMTLFPTGSNINWGPLFPTVIAIACLLVGASTRPDIIAVALVIPPLMAAAMVPVMYYLGKFCGDWKTGLLSAFFITVVSGQYFSRSFYGYIDHHIAEVLFSAIFCLFYIYTLYSVKDAKIVLSDFKSYKTLIYLSILTGFAYMLGFLVMPTMILFAMIAGIFTVVQFFVDGMRGRTSEYLVVINTIVFTTVIICTLVFGIKTDGFALISYTIAHIFALLALIAGTVTLYVIHWKFGKVNYFNAVGVTIGIVFAAVIGLFIFLPNLYEMFVVSFIAFFGQQAISNTIQEAMPWSSAQAWATFNYGLLMMFGGIGVMFYKNIKDERPHYVFGLIWSLIILVSAWQHIRYEYYLTVPLVLLSAICASYVIELGLPIILKFKDGFSANPKEKIVVDEKPKNKKLRKSLKKNEYSDPTDHIISALVIGIIIFGGLFAFTSFSMNYENALAGTGMRMNLDWKESLDWMAVNTPETGVNYTEVYDPTTFKYPAQAYGVMSWWDYGHLITHIANRIPNANPFQQGVIGVNGSASFFISPTELEGNTVLDNVKTKYIITDIEMDTGKFWAMATWYNATLGGAPYQMWMLTPQNTMNGGYSSTQVNTKAYYETMISRLHNFDGSLTDPQIGYYVEYVDPMISQVSLPVINNVLEMNISDIDAKISEYEQRAPAGYHATSISPIITVSTHKIPALQHYRLVHESPTTAFKQGSDDVKYVKTFEYVKGARIMGNGTIEINLVTNTGRTFVYRQESINGTFTVPYSTENNPNMIQALGKYRIVGTDLEFDVPEQAVIRGGIWKQVN